MTEFLFYQLHHQRTEDVLPALLEKSLERGWRVVVQCAAEERLDALDAHLWTYRENSFLPHGTFREATAAEHPVLLTLDGHNPNAATVRFLIDGAPPPPAEDAAQYQRVVLLYDGDDGEAVAAARHHAEAAAARGLAVTFWQADGNGRWRRPSPKSATQTVE